MSTSTRPPATGAPAVLAEATRVVAELREVLWAARTPVEKAETVAAIEELKTVLDAVELDVVADLEASRGVQALGWASTKDFLTAVSGGHRGAGAAMVRLAASLQEPVMAPVRSSLREGRLSRVKADVIDAAVDRLPGSAEVRERGVEVLLTEAERLDASDLRRVGRRLVEIVDPDGVERAAEKELDRLERAAHHDRHLVIRDDGAGGAWIRGRCASEDAVMLRTTLLPLSKPRPAAGPECDPATCTAPGCGHDGRDPRDHGARTLDALVEACRLLQTVDLLPETHGATPRVTLTMPLDSLREGHGYAVSDTGDDLTAGVVRRLACDADVVPVVLGTDSEVLDVGRRQRLVTTPLWRALVTRDQHCRFPRCTRPPIMCHAHHIEHWVDGGPTSLDNLLLLCGHHHRLVHAGPWTITGSPGRSELEFRPPDELSRRRGAWASWPDRAPPAVPQPA